MSAQFPKFEQVHFLEIVEKERLAGKEGTAVQLAEDRAEARAKLRAGAPS